ncbi:Fic family protein [Chitinophaga sedimenti]|uniref:Fic family protein n=1 Tax=Chitinophaga sedimenti TaxID=2033606 RepID=UPI00200575AE|nr:Fic family protein [Chitinophaga sedimenti]MCK7559858.1 Fic family protein [Chitinophaga sedimenti]
MLDHDQVRSSIARRLGMDIGGLVPADRNVEGVVEMMLDATQRYEKPLTAERLFGWQASLFPTGWSGMHRVEVGGWRTDKDGPMQVISGAMGPETVHFQAPSVALLHAEMDAFITWFNNAHTIDPVLKAAIAHLWFVTIHPFDDGNGRVARALMDMQLARAEETQQRFYSMSAQIRQERKDYYKILESTQRDTLDITAWLTWFLQCLERAIAATDQTLSVVKMKARFWGLPGAEQVSERQKLMLNELLEGFKGKLTSSKWALMTKTSQDTAVRDIQDLIDRGLLLKEDAGGRSTSYVLNLPG